jgi:hypothetical protein
MSRLRRALSLSHCSSIHITVPHAAAAAAVVAEAHSLGVSCHVTRVHTHRLSCGGCSRQLACDKLVRQDQLILAQCLTNHKRRLRDWQHQ